ncbi:hypothetical protein ScPMuIL_000586 [Solemya velum]
MVARLEVTFGISWTYQVGDQELKVGMSKLYFLAIAIAMIAVVYGGGKVKKCHGKDITTLILGDPNTPEGAIAMEVEDMEGTAAMEEGTAATEEDTVDMGEDTADMGEDTADMEGDTAAMVAVMAAMVGDTEGMADMVTEEKTDWEAADWEVGDGEAAEWEVWVGEAVDWEVGEVDGALVVDTDGEAAVWEVGEVDGALVVVAATVEDGEAEDGEVNGEQVMKSKDECGALITTGHGRFYCNGLDLTIAVDSAALEEMIAATGPIFIRLQSFPLPTVAAINGLAFAGGAVLATAHDYRVKNSKRGWICLNGVDIHIVIPEATFRTSSKEDCKALITTGHGKFYSNGMDLTIAVDPSALGDLVANTGSFFKRLQSFPLPTVAAINGHAFAGGAILATAHDYRVMNSKRGWICWNEVDINLVIPEALSPLLRCKLSPKVLRDGILFGKRFTAQEALSNGLVDVITDADRLVDVSENLLSRVIGRNVTKTNAYTRYKADVPASTSELSWKNRNRINRPTRC